MSEEVKKSNPTCIDKISANIAIQIKFDPITLNWYIKDVKMSHAEFLDSAKLKSWEFIDEQKSASVNRSDQE